MSLQSWFDRGQNRESGDGEHVDYGNAGITNVQAGGGPADPN